MADNGEGRTRDRAGKAMAPGGDQDWAELVPLDALTRLDGRARAWATGPIEAPRLLAGGTQNILLRFDRAGARLRAAPPAQAPARQLQRDHAPRGARAGGAKGHATCAIPALIAACPAEDVIGAAFYLMEPVEGFTPRDEMPALHAGDPAIRHRMGLEMVDAIAALWQGRLCARGPRAVSAGPTASSSARSARWRAQLESYHEHRRLARARRPARRRRDRPLAGRQPAADFTPGLIHGDFHFANVLFRRDSARAGRDGRLGAGHGRRADGRPGRAALQLAARTARRPARSSPGPAFRPAPS